METAGLNALAFVAPGASLTVGASLRADAHDAAPAGTQLLLKALIDRGAAALLLLLLLPLLLMVALLVRLDSRGPILFRQARVGRNDETFMIWKFRTMHHAMTDAEARLQTSRGDTRVTRVGRALRRLSLDELPQLVNVFRGDMSLVGPRPHTPTMAIGGRALHEIVGAYALRHAVRPGITGWAQVNRSRGELRTTDDVRRRVQLDLTYIENWSVLLDLRILMLTVWREVLSSRAY